MLDDEEPDLVCGRCWLPLLDERSGSVKRKKEVSLRTEETKVARMDDGFCICFTRQVVEGRETTADISDAEYSAMDGVY